MLNPDGVIAGNYRTSMAGSDLNRKFDDPDHRLHPSVWNIKRMTEQITQSSVQNLQFYLDMHGHSRKKNVFIFGPQVPIHSDKYLKMRVIPKLIAEETEMFRYHSCMFSNEKSKETAARITLYRQFNIYNCFTLEASFHGYFDRDKVTNEFTESLYE
jgi:cytosolic carboxypeptidase protein 2/3